MKVKLARKPWEDKRGEHSQKLYVPHSEMHKEQDKVRRISDIQKSTESTAKNSSNRKYLKGR